MSVRPASEPAVYRHTAGGNQVYAVSMDAWNKTQRRIEALEAETSKTQVTVTTKLRRIFDRLEAVDEYVEILRKNVRLLHESRMRTDRALRTLKMTLSKKESNDDDILATLLQALALWEEENKEQRLRDEEDAQKKRLRELEALQHDKRS